MDRRVFMGFDGPCWRIVELRGESFAARGNVRDGEWTDALLLRHSDAYV